MGAEMELWLVRHGETEWSAAGRHTSRTDIPLTELGRRRAAVLGKYLAGTKFAAVLRSPMLRAKQTCEIAGFGDVAVVDDGLKEWDYGVYEGRTSKDIQAEIPGWSVWTSPIVGGETVEQVGARADAVLARVTPLLAGGDVALVGHGHSLRVLTARWLGLEPAACRLFRLDTGTVCTLAREHDRPVIISWNVPARGQGPAAGPGLRRSRRAIP